MEEPINFLSWGLFTTNDGNNRLIPIGFPFSVSLSSVVRLVTQSESKPYIYTVVGRYSTQGAGTQRMDNKILF